ncbi:MAG: RNA-binding protein [Oscillospiraceae bacterium]|nr:RNA-binding protein [Oscillospiraceae bacterium]
MDHNDKLLAARTEDLFSLCEKYSSPVFSDFLDGAEQAVIHDKVIFPFGYNVMYSGGFDEAEKKMLGVFPEWTEPDALEFPMSCLKIEGGFTKKLNHRDYLGTIMSLGIAQSKLGDIVVNDGFAYVFLHSDITGYIKDNLHKIGNQGVSVTEITNFGDIKIERKYKTIGTVCASGRLDAVVGAAANVSRQISSGLINGGKVKVNHREITKVSEPVKEGDLLSIRGYGRFLIHSFDGETRKNRLHITLKQYI